MALIDFKGKPLRLHKTGIRYPVDAVLTEEDGENVLTLTARINFIDFLMLEQGGIPAAYKDAVLAGFRDWSGSYLVFRDQPLSVVVNVNETESIVDTIFVYVLDQEASNGMRDQYGRMKLRQAEAFMANARSSATIGPKVLEWRSWFPKSIYLFQNDLSDLERGRTVARHEFGHMLGIGDLYRDYSTGLRGVEGDKYPDLAPYFRGKATFDMVMCNNGAVTNNDIEMVLLAFREGRMQNYQKKKKSDKLSAALGRGN
jgi:hypothetical protein